jgi:alpha-L-fucosidase
MPYAAEWESLRTVKVPRWLKEGKFGIYTHWGVYSVPGFETCWYPHQMYYRGSKVYDHHVKTYGDPSVFGYKDFIPLFTAPKFDPDEWAEIFAGSGAKFAGPVAEHHDGFAMWDTAYSEWNAVKMGPRRDIVAELEKSIRSRGMQFMVSLHNLENWFFYPHWWKEYDCADPRYAGLYGDIHDEDREDLRSRFQEWWDWYPQTKPSIKALESWLGKIKELTGRFSPDLLWFDGGLQFAREDYKKEMAAWYYNEMEQKGREGIIAYKLKDMIAGSALNDVELGGLDRMQYGQWLTDTTVERGPLISWSWAEGLVYKEAEELIQNLVDNISKNGFFLLNVGPRPDGSIPAEIQAVLKDIGRWLAINGEAVYGTDIWFTHGEGPTKGGSGDMAEVKGEVLKYTPQDIRYMRRGDTIYAFTFAWSDEYKLTALRSLYPGEVTRVTMLGSDEPLQFQQTCQDGLRVTAPGTRPGKYLHTLKIERGGEKRERLR